MFNTIYAITSAYKVIMKHSPRDFVFLDLINTLTEVRYAF